MSPVARRGAVLAAGALGTVGSLLLAGVGNSGAPHPPAAYWPFVPPLSSIRVGGGQALTLSRVGLLLLVLGWVTLGALVQQRAVRARSLLVITGLWALPLLSSPPLFSDDAYDYAASGALQTHGLDPYLVGPHSLGASRVAGVVSPAWSRTPTPYGPGFLLITRAISAVAGAHDIVAVTLLRVLAVIAVAVLAWVSVLLARSLGRRSTPVLWAVVANPLVLTAYVGGAHNDAMMMAMVVAAFLLHRRGHTVAALALTVLAAELKVIAVIATAVLLADLLRGRERPGSTLPAVRRAALRSATAAAAFALLTSALGLPLGHGLGGGWGWVGALNVPGRVQTSVTPVDAVFDLLHPPLRVALPRNHRPMLPFDLQPLLLDLRAVALSAATVGCAALVLRVRRLGVERAAGLALLTVALLGTILWPWYLLWSLALLAIAGAQRERITVAALSVTLLWVSSPGGHTLWGDPRHAPGRVTADQLTIVIAVAVGAVLTVTRTGSRRRDERQPTAGGRPRQMVTVAGVPAGPAWAALDATL